MDKKEHKTRKDKQTNIKRKTKSITQNIPLKARKQKIKIDLKKIT